VPLKLPKLVQETMLGEALASAYERSRCAVVVSDDDGNILAANDAAAELFGYDREELTQLQARDISGRSHFDETVPIYERLMGGEQVFDEAVLRRKDGVVGTIKFRAMNGNLGRLPVLISITHEIDTFTPLPR
jgi:PAS domain S-box-containing protein